MAKPTGEEIATHYRAAHQRIAGLTRTLDPPGLATPVPATPGWSVQDVVAHLAAVATDALGGRLTGMPTDEFTAAQVADRRGRSLGEVLAEWDGTVESMAEAARAGLAPPQLAVDALTHEQDVRGALRLAPEITADELRFCTSVYLTGLSHVLRGAGVAPLRVSATDTDLEVVAGDRDQEPVASLAATEFELFRAVSGRRSRSQVAGYDWTGDPGPFLDRLNVFGAPPSTDVTDG